MTGCQTRTIIKQQTRGKLVLPALYNCINYIKLQMQPKQKRWKEYAEYPESRYAQIMNNTTANAASLTETPESTYTKWYKLYKSNLLLF
jgi:hypothetical protein